jgi:hypothetical protein
MKLRQPIKPLGDPRRHGIFAACPTANQTVVHAQQFGKAAARP